MNIQIKKYGEKHVIISPKDLQKLVEIAEKLEPIEIESNLSVEEIEAREDDFERKLLAEGFISSIPTRNETDEEFDSFEPIEFEDDRFRK